MSNSEHKAKMTANREDFVDRLMAVLKDDPDADQYIKDYAETRGYLLELIEKDGSVLDGLVEALENHLEK